MPQADAEENIRTAEEFDRTVLLTSFSDHRRTTGMRSPSQGHACGNRISAEMIKMGYTMSRIQEPHDIGDNGSNVRYRRKT